MKKVILMMIAVIALMGIGTASATSNTLRPFSGPQFRAVKRVFYKTTNTATSHSCRLAYNRTITACAASFSDGSSLGMGSFRYGACGLKWQMYLNNRKYGVLHLNRHFFC